MWKWFWQPSFPNLSFSTLLWNLRSFISFMLSISSFHLLCQHSNIHWLKINLWIIMIIYYQQKICQVTYPCSSSKSLRMSLWMSYSRVRGAFNQNKTVHGGHVINSEILRPSDSHAHLSRMRETKTSTAMKYLSTLIFPCIMVLSF